MATPSYQIPDDPARCDECGRYAAVRTCSRCGVSARILDCGHQAQPRPLAAGLADGTRLHRDYCAACAADPIHEAY